MNSIEQWNNLSKHRAHKILKEVYGESLKLPVMIKEVITSYLGDVEIQSRMDFPFKQGVSAFSTRDMDLGWLIVLNGNESIVRQRFSAAHELAHIVLVPNEPAIVYHSDDNNSWVEKLCDRFAGDILMPEQAVLNVYQYEPLPYVEYIAKLFKVSKQVAKIQLEHLGLPFESMPDIY